MISWGSFGSIAQLHVVNRLSEILAITDVRKQSNMAYRVALVRSNSVLRRVRDGTVRSLMSREGIRRRVFV